MKHTAFIKVLSANDVGSTGSNQAGILVPKANGELLAFLPHLDAGIKNPSVWIDCIDEDSLERRFRYVYYNNALHDAGGTRKEYRITHMTGYLRGLGACVGDAVEISRGVKDQSYRIRLIRKEAPSVLSVTEAGSGVRIRIRTGWSRVH